MTLKQIVEENDTQAGRVFDWTIQGLIVFSLLTFSVETLPNLSQQTQNWLFYAECLTVGIFTLEYALRVIVADRKFRFIFSFFGIIDLLSILPFYFSATVDLRTIRAFRLLRLLRLLKLARYSRAVQRFHRALMIAKEELILFMLVTLILLYLAAVGIYHFERDAQPEAFASVFHSLWWAVATVTTVGYGDVYPVTVGGKIFTFLILVLGLGVISVPSGIIASAFSKARELEE